MFGMAQGVARVSIFQFHHRPDIPCAERLGRGAVLPIKNIDLPKAFADLAVSVIDIEAGPHGPGIDSKERKIACLRFAAGLKDIKIGFWPVESNFGLAP